MRILITGSSGLVGAAATARLQDDGHDVVPLRRNTNQAPGWNPADGEINLGGVTPFDAVIHLAGENIADGRWTAAKKARILASRADATRQLCEALAAQPTPPGVLISASAIGIYGNRGDAPLDEQSAPGDDFLAEVCKQWEAATVPAVEAGIRVVNARIGMVLAPDGGALKKMVPPFRLGLGGVVGDGRQFMSWVALPDLVAMMAFVLARSELSGPVNMVSPGAVTNREFTKALGKALRRPTIAPMPAFAARLVFGEMADALLLASQRVVPTRLQELGFSCIHQRIDATLLALLT